MMQIFATYRPPFGYQPEVLSLPPGLTLAEIVGLMPGLPDDFPARGEICINGHLIDRRRWARVRPRPPGTGAPVEVTLHSAPADGGEGGGKKILALVASIALTAFSGGIAAGNAAGLLGAKFAAGTFGARALALGVSLVGSLAISALAAPPAAQRDRSAPDPGDAGAEGNALAPNGAIPRVFGERKVFPPFACDPLIYFDGQDEVVEAIYALNGPHRITDIRLGDAPITDAGVEYEVREGWPGDARLTLTRRQSKSANMQTEMRGHVVDADDGSMLAQSTGNPTDDLPQPVIMTTRDAPDEQQLQIVFPGGLNRNASESTRLRVPLRLEIREAGDTDWTPLPELHFQAANVRQMRATIRLVWSDEAVTPDAPPTEGWVEARRFSPGQTAVPASADWQPRATFGASGDAWLNSANLGSTGVQNVALSRYTATIRLDPAVFPPGRYDLRLTRGAAIDASLYSPSSYEYDGSVWDFWGYRGAGDIASNRDGVYDTVYLLRSVSIWNEHPVPTDDVALIAIRARNRQLAALSCTAGGWVRDWDGTGWRDWVVTDNPAPHLRDVYRGAINANPVPASVVDDAGLVAWRAAGHSCNVISEDRSVADLAQLLAGCGYARPAMSDLYGVVRDYDRSAEAPVQMFSPRNSRSFRWDKGFARVPDALRVTFRDSARDYEERQITVPRPGFIGAPRLIEQVSYDGLVTEAEVVARARYDQAQARWRSTFYSLEAPPEAIVARRGDLVAVQHDMLSAYGGAARIIGRTLDGSGDVTHLQLDAPVRLPGGPDMLSVADLLQVEDMLQLGATAACIIRGPDGPGDLLPLANAAGVTADLELVTPIPAADAPVGGLVVAGQAGQEILRLIVWSVDPQDDYTSTLTLVDEAPEIWS